MYQKSQGVQMPDINELLCKQQVLMWYRSISSQPSHFPFVYLKWITFSLISLTSSELPIKTGWNNAYHETSQGQELLGFSYLFLLLVLHYRRVPTTGCGKEGPERPNACRAVGAHEGDAREGSARHAAQGTQAMHVSSVPHAALLLLLSMSGTNKINHRNQEVI